MDDNTKSDIQIDVEQLPEQKEAGSVFSVIAEAFYITKPNLLVVVGFIAIAARRLN